MENDYAGRMQYVNLSSPYQTSLTEVMSAERYHKQNKKHNFFPLIGFCFSECIMHLRDLRKTSGPEMVRKPHKIYSMFGRFEILCMKGLFFMLGSRV